MRAFIVVYLLMMSAAAFAQDGAGALDTRLTPVGAERAGNAAGTIPAWTGGYTAVPEGFRQGDVRPDPFADDRPVMEITARNSTAYADQLPEGAKALFAKYPGYRMKIYPTRRSAAAPQWVYDNIRRNLDRAKPVARGAAYGVQGAVGGIPYPIPKSGIEVVWNHLLGFWGPARETRLSTFVVSAAGTVDLTAEYVEVADFPYYDPAATPESFGPYYFKTRRIGLAPPANYGAGYLAWQPIDIAETKFAAWRYVPGERRVRRGPSLSYDTPDPDASGYQALDEYYVFFGGPDRYDFTLLGKREMFVPYNNNALHARAPREVLGPQHLDPDAVRYELHRVWVVEGKLRDGENHVVARRRLYFDEDTWLAVYSDSWDEDGKLWKFGHGTMYLIPDLPAVIIGSQAVYDLLLGGYVFGFGFSEGSAHYKVTAPHPAAELDPQALIARAPR